MDHEHVVNHNNSSRLKSENVTFTSFPKPPSIALLQRPLSALARHRIHELSDIREVSNSSKGGTVRTTKIDLTDGTSDVKLFGLSKRQDTGSESVSSAEYVTPAPAPVPKGLPPVTPPKGMGSRATSALSLPSADVPERRSSASFLNQSIVGSRQGSMQNFPSLKLIDHENAGKVIPSQGRADSPLRTAIEKSAVSSDFMRHSPSRTFIRTVPPVEILDHGSSKHPRVELRLHLLSPLFVGGGTIEGRISLVVDATSSRKAKTRPISISKLSVDVLGVEEASDGRKWIFLSLATELFDKQHPPPASLVFPLQSSAGPELFWELKSGTTALPFCVNLPLNLGPPPYLSKQASIRYLLCPTLVVKEGDKKSIVRQTWDVQMLTVHDPEKALASLPSPLLASDQLLIQSGLEMQSVKITAGLHRQTWVNGADIFIDVHIVNNTSRLIKKIEAQIEKITLWYLHAAAGTAEKSASHLRLPKRSESEYISHSVVKKSKDWSGIMANSSEIRTCKIHAPRGHVTISTGRYFEVRYFLNVSVSVTMFKNIAVQLPITLIHMNSLDILPNALAQVAASIEAKRARTVPITSQAPIYPRYYHGQAFTASGRHQSDRGRNISVIGDDVSLLTHELESSPRRYPHSKCYHPDRTSTLSTSISREHDARSCGAQFSHHHHVHRPMCYHCQIIPDGLIQNSSTANIPVGPRLPRLQVSTSGLGFSESEFEVPPDSPPKKVMLSENERKMIHQQHELKLQREWSQKQKENTLKEKVLRGKATAIRSNTSKEKVEDLGQEGYWGWKNVAAATDAGPKMHDFGNRSSFSTAPVRANSRSGARNLVLVPSSGNGPLRARSRTNPENMGMRKVADRRSGPRPVHVRGRGALGHRRNQRSLDQPEPSSFARMRADGSVFGYPDDFNRRTRHSIMQQSSKKSMERQPRSSLEQQQPASLSMQTSEEGC